MLLRGQLLSPTVATPFTGALSFPRCWLLWLALELRDEADDAEEVCAAPDDMAATAATAAAVSAVAAAAEDGDDEVNDNADGVSTSSSSVV
jgi:hypothetical protein